MSLPNIAHARVSNECPLRTNDVTKCVGVLASHPDSRDVHLHSLSINFHGAELLVDCKVELNTGRRYGLVGLNGCGTSSFLPGFSITGTFFISSPVNIYGIFFIYKNV